MSDINKGVVKDDINNEIKDGPKLLSRENIKSYLYVLATIFGIIGIFYLITFAFGISIAPNLGGNQGGGGPQQGGGGPPQKVGDSPPQGGNPPPNRSMNQGGVSWHK